MKTNIVVQSYGLEVTEQEIVNMVKEQWVKEGNFVKDIKTLNLYVKPDERKVYWVINEEYTGEIDI